MTTAEFCRRSGLTRRQAYYWHRLKILEGWTPLDLLRVAIRRRLRAAFRRGWFRHLPRITDVLAVFRNVIRVV